MPPMRLPFEIRGHDRIASATIPRKVSTTAQKSRINHVEDIKL